MAKIKVQNVGGTYEALATEVGQIDTSNIKIDATDPSYVLIRAKYVLVEDLPLKP